MNQTSAPAAAGTQPRHSFWKSALSAIKLVAVNFLVFAVLVELICLVFINTTNWRSSKPTYHVNYNSFWADINPVFGVWHRPEGHFYHQGGCFSVEYTTNSYGARDRERSLHSSHPRTVVLGDSMIEGLGLADRDRLTNILEKRSGEEYLNFGTSGDFGPLQYALLYKTLASQFDHDTVLVSILADNDFLDMSLDYGKVHHAGRYRPYYASDFSIVYTGHVRPDAGESFRDHAEAVLRAYLASYHVGQYLYSSLYWRMAPPYSGYNDFTEVDFARLQKALLDIKSTSESRHARMGVFIIPTYNDFLRLQRSGANRLGPLLAAWGERNAIPVQDLLPEMYARAGASYPSLFLSCDGHWSPHGSAMAADVLQPWLAQLKAEGGPTPSVPKGKREAP
jgi:hypothetical protein